MDDLISRLAAIDEIGKKSDEVYITKQKGATFPHNDFFQGMAYAEDVIKHLPSAQPMRKKGLWLYGEERKFLDLANADEQYKALGYPYMRYVNLSCSCCRMVTIVNESVAYKYCPHCGADMREEQE